MEHRDPPAPEAPRRPSPFPALLAAVVAVVGHLPALGAWWCRDDWGLLARAAGVADAAPGWPVRWLSQHAYWSLTWPVFGLAAAPHAVVRLALHGAAAWLVVRLARRGGLGDAGAAVAGLVYAASPLAFTPLYWGAGVQELLGVFLALAAVACWLAGRRGGAGALVAAALAAAGSLLSKECGLGLPVLFGLFAWLGLGVRREHRALAWSLVAVLAAAAAATGWLVLRSFATGPGEPYDLGGVRVMLTNLGVFGWWLLSPGPLLAGAMTRLMVAVGGAMFVLWLGWGAARWRVGARLPLLAWAAAVLSLAPALPLRQHVAPYLALAALAAWALALGALVPRRWELRLPVLLAAAVLAVVWGVFGMRTRLTQRNALGLPADNLVAATSLSWEACRTLRSLPTLAGGDWPPHVVLLQLPTGPNALELADRFGERWTAPSDLREALGGDLGPALVLPPQVHAGWASGLATAPRDAVVLVESGTGLRFWGRTGHAALYAALTEVGLGHFERARRHLRRAGELNADVMLFVFDEGQMIIPLAAVERRQREFIDWTVGLLAEGRSPVEVGGLQEMFLQLLSSCTGRSVAELTAGSRPAHSPAAPPPAAAPGDSAAGRP